MLECLFIAYLIAELQIWLCRHQAGPVFTIILSFLNIAHTLLVQPICFMKAASACVLEGLHTDVYHLYTKHLLLSKTNSCLLAHTLLYGRGGSEAFLDVKGRESKRNLMLWGTCLNNKPLNNQLTNSSTTTNLFIHIDTQQSMWVTYILGLGMYKSIQDYMIIVWLL